MCDGGDATRILFLFLSLVCLSSGDYSCSKEKASECVGGLKMVRDMYANKTALRNTCRQLDSTMSCITTYVSKCSRGHETSPFSKINRKIRIWMGKHCNHRKLKEQDIVVNCRNNYTEEIEERCESLKPKITQRAKHSSSKRQAVKKICWMYYNYENCIHDALTSSCGDKSARYLERKIFSKLSAVEDMKKCYSGGYNGDGKSVDHNKNVLVTTFLLLIIHFVLM
ncbi:Uncharacterised protein g6409 [Pycnogonum litorale]